MKKIISFILCAAFICTAACIPVFASEGSSLTVPDGYKAITTRAELAGIANALGGNYILMNDIDLGGKDAPWMPIGTAGAAFTGVFDGNGHVVRGLYISSSYLDYQGLFGMNCGTVKNLTVQGNVSGDEYIGGIAGASVAGNGVSALIKNCRNECTVTGRGNYVGGIAGISQSTLSAGSSSAEIIGCVNAGSVTGGGKYTGGIAGGSSAYVSSSSVRSASVNTNVKDCHNTGVIAGNKAAGGIVGLNQAYTKQSNTAAKAFAVVTECTNSRMVGTTSDACGGIVGINDVTTYAEATARVFRCVNAGTITGGGLDAGGIVSRSMSETSTTKATGKAEIYDCRNIGAIKASTYVGGIAAYDCANSKYGTSSANVSTCFSNGKVSATGGGAYAGGVIGYKYIGANAVYASGLEKISKAEIKKCYYLSDSAGTGIGYGTDTVKGYTASQCAVQSNFSGFNFTNTWVMRRGFPNIKGLNSASALSTVSGKLTIKGDPLPGNVITLDTSDLRPTDAKYTIDWYRNGEKVHTGDSYTAVSDDLGQNLYAVLRGKTNTRGSVRSETFFNRYDAINEKPVITGDAYYGGTVTASFADKNITADFEWLVGGKKVGDGYKYTLTADDVGGRLVCRAYGYGHYYGSSDSAYVTVGKRPISGEIKYDFTVLKYGTPVYLDLGNVDGAGQFEFSAEWTRDDGEKRSGYPLATDEDDIGHTFTAAITVTESTLYTGSLECAEEIEISNWANPYTDVKYKSWYNDVVGDVTERGLFNGMTKRTFAPDSNITRGMFVTVLARMSGETVDNNVTTPFTDVKKRKYYTGAVKWASDAGIVKGMTETTFAPDSNITREQFCTMLVRYAQYKGDELTYTEEKPVFADAKSVSKYARDSVRLMQNMGIVNGRGGNKFAPKAFATRAEIAAVISRYLTATENKGE